MMQNLMTLGVMARFQLRKFFLDEKGEVNIVATVVLIGIAVILALVFKNYILNLLGTLFNNLIDTTSDAFATPPPS